MGSSSGSYKCGGSLSSSSNLSPLAPPFMVDKSLTRSSPTNPAMNFHELPVFSTVFDPAGPFSSAGRKFGATEPLGSTTCASSGGVYGFPGSQSSNSDVYYVGHSAGTGYDPFSYDQFPNTMPARDGDDVLKPYYGPYVSSPPQCKDTFSGANYDLLSSSGAGHFTGYGSRQVDRKQGAPSDGEYKPEWGGFWGGLGNSEHRNWTKYAPSSGVKDFNLFDLSSDKNHLSGDGSDQSHPFDDTAIKGCLFGDASSKGPLFGDVGNKSNLKQGACVSQGLDSHGEGTSVLDNSFDIFGGTYHFASLGIHQQGQNLSFKNSGGSSSDCLRMSGFVSVAAAIESPGLQRPLLESVSNLSGPQKANGFSSEDHFSQSGCYMFGCTSTTSTFPITVTNAQSGGGTSSAGSTLSGIPVNPMVAEIACSTIHSSGKDRFYQKESEIALGMEDVGFQPRVVITRPLPLPKFGSSSQKGETVNDDSDVEFTSTKTKFTPQATPQFSCNGFTPKIDDAEVSCSIEKHSSGSDLHNPAEDSPCWKGASSTRFSPFKVSDDVSSEIFVSHEDGCKSPRTEEPHKKNLPVDSSDSVDISSEKLGVSTFPEKPAVPNCTSVHEGSCPLNQKSYCIDLNIPDGLEFLDDCHVSTKKDSSISSNPRSDLDSKPPLVTELILEEAEVLSGLSTSEASVTAKCGTYTPKAAQKSSYTLSDNVNNSSCSTWGDKASLKHGQSTKKSPESRFEVNVALKAMMKLSQMLRYYCSRNPTALTVQQSVTLDQIINNLDASMSEMARQTRQTRMLSTQDSHLLKELLVSEMVNDAEIVSVASEQGRTAEDFLDSVKNDVDALQDDNMTQAIKKILSDNLDEGINHPELLYRNLWLEAEAALCLMTTKARFHRTNIEMENSLHDRMNDKENPSSPKISSDEQENVGAAPDCKDSPAPVCDHASQKFSATTQRKGTDEIPVSNSQQLILNCMKHSRQKEPRTDKVCPAVLYESRPFIFDNDAGAGAANYGHDVENSAMAGYQILKSHGGGSQALKDKGKKSSNEDILSQDTSAVDTLFSGPTIYSHDPDSPVMARYQILKSRGDDTHTLNTAGKRSPGEENYDLSSLDTSGKDGMNVLTNDVETSFMARDQILNCRISTTHSLYEGKQLARGENDLIGGDTLNPDEQFMSPKLFNSISSTDEGQGSVMTRFRIIQNRVNGLNCVDKEPVPTEASMPTAKEVTEAHGWTQQKSSFMTNTFGPYLDFSKDKDVQRLGVAVDGEPLTASYKVKQLSTEILEGWYDNDCSSCDWEHVSKEELRRQN